VDSSLTLIERTKTSHYDVVILGGGPAGTATALMLRHHAPHLNVALVERSHYEGLRIGETLPPTVQPLLEQLGVWDAFLADGHLPAYGSCSAWGADRLEENEFIYNPLGRGWHLDRRRFDALLARSAEAAGVVVRNHLRFTGSTRTEDGRWQLTFHRLANKEVDWTASVVIDATGRRAVFAQAQGVKRVRMDRLIGTALFYALPDDRPLADTYTLVEAVPNGWWYSALVPDNKIAVVYMTDTDLLRAQRTSDPTLWRQQLDATRHTRSRLTGAKPLGEPMVQAAYSHRLEQMSGDGWIAVGDAAMTYDPLSSLGIFKGLRSGIVAAYAIGDQLAGRDGFIKYNGVLAGEFEGYLQTRMDFYRQEQRWPDSPFWRRRFDQISLDPDHLMHTTAKAADPNSFANLSMHLPLDDLAGLCELCRLPRPASEIVREFTGHGRAIPDRRVILALQYLVENGLIETAAL
jgi:flavin-dependent dehydrogenase